MSESARVSPRDDGAPVGRRIVIGMVVAGGAAVVGSRPAITRFERLLRRFDSRRRFGGGHPARRSR